LCKIQFTPGKELHLWLGEKMKNTEEINKENTLTCVYCGHAYPPGTPTHGSSVLTEHIKGCEKHPMREAETKIAKLRAALIGLVGAEKREELESMEAFTRQYMAIGQVPNKDGIASINAFHALIETEI
jgi:hypothetical protein